jgi:aminoglycoside phosphotransferase (APT) family kinase protein
MTSAARAPARVLPGPFSVRACLETPAGYVWVDRPREPFDPRALERLDAVRRLVAPAYADVDALVPRAPDPQAVVYPAVATDRLLLDSLFVGRARIDALETTLLRLGAFLAGLHAVDLDEAARDLLPTRAAATLVPPGGPRDASLDDALDDARAKLPLDAAQRLAAWSDAATGVNAGRAPSLLHGRMSTASIASDPATPERLAVLGWLEAAIGDPVTDLAYLVGELAEAVAIGALTAEDAARLGSAFLRSHDTAGLREHAAHRVVDHVTIRMWTAEGAEDLAPFLSGTERALDALMHDIDEGGGAA